MEQAALFLLNVSLYFGIYVIIVISLNMEAGYLGLPNFGKMIGAITGAFTTSYLTGRITVLLYNRLAEEAPLVYESYIRDNALIMHKLNIWLEKEPLISVLVLIVTLMMSAAFGAAMGYIASYPAIRLREDYLGITLVAMGEVLRAIGQNYTPIAGGTVGIQVPDLFRWAGDKRFVVSVLTIVVIAALVFVFINSILNTPFGRVLRAIRDNEDAILSLGRDIVHYRKRVICLGTAIAALAGSLYALYTSSVVATAFDRVTWTFWPWVMMMLGGAGNNFGVLIGVGAFVLVRSSIHTYKTVLERFVPFNVMWLDYLLLSIAIMAILMVRPQGILPERKIKTLPFERYEKRQ